MGRMPIDVMQRLNYGGPIIAVNVFPDVDLLRDYRFGPSVSGWRASPATTSTWSIHGRPCSRRGSRASTLTRYPASSRRGTSLPPTYPVAPVTRISSVGWESVVSMPLVYPNRMSYHSGLDGGERCEADGIVAKQGDVFGRAA